MKERDLILGVLATQAGFVTPAQVMEAAAVLIGKAGDSLLDQLQRNGALTSERRRVLEIMAESALSRTESEKVTSVRIRGGGAGRRIAREFSILIESDKADGST